MSSAIKDINEYEEALAFRQDPTDYAEFQDIAPYNKLQDGKWTSLWLNCHPLARKISYRFSDDYDGKLLLLELNKMKERIDELSNSLNEYKREVMPRRRELCSLIKEQEELCGEECDQMLQKHLDECMGFDGKYKCTKDYLSYGCQFKENGRCSHYYDIERANEEIDYFDYFEHQDKSRINELKYRYERALAVKEDRLQEYLDDLYYDDW